MTVETTINRTAYLGNGSTTTFAVPFKFLEPEHLVVVLTTAGADAPLMVAAVPPDAVACCRELAAIGAACHRLAA